METTAVPSEIGGNLLFRNSSDFSYYIEIMAIQEGSTCTQVILDYCDTRDIEPDDIAKLIGPSLRGKLHLEMISRGLLPENANLDAF